jgi:hypothetical protein
MKRRTLLVCTIVAMLPTVCAAPALAENSSLNQKILPLNCVFEVVSDGTGTVRYLTPSECGVLVTPSPGSGSQPVTSGSPTGASPSHVAQVQNPGTYNTARTVFFVPANSGTHAGNPANTELRLPWQPIATVASQNATKSPNTTKAGLSTKTVTAVAAVGTIGVAVLVLLLI